VSAAWIRREPTTREGLAVGVAALGVGAVIGCAVYYLGRVLVARDELESEPPSSPGRALPRPRESGRTR
jgi:hypothetical protein